MPNVRIIDRPSFNITGRKTYISGPDNEQFGRFWEQVRAEGLLAIFDQVRKQSGHFPGPQTGGAMLGVSRVEKDPAKRDFDYMIAIEVPGDFKDGDLEVYQVPAARWAVFECRGKVPEAIVTSEIYAFSQWLPNSGYRHALAPEMEVYLATGEEDTCEFWLPVEK
ncbi:MAG: AraC family transcriptional regulator [Chloroflexi bacterium]|nr:MAG: AraC family transcriptional regulator [Chloroflexota bacterium]